MPRASSALLLFDSPSERRRVQDFDGRVADRQLQGDAAAHAVAEHVGLVDVQVTDQRRGVVGHLLIGERAIDVGRTPVPLLLGRDHPPRLRQPGQDRADHVDRHVRAMQDDQRPARPVDLVVHVERADRRVARPCVGTSHRLSFPPMSVELLSVPQ
jgi:hypothetical protein